MLLPLPQGVPCAWVCATVDLIAGFTLVRSPQPSGMAERLMKIGKRDIGYVHDGLDGRAVIRLIKVFLSCPKGGSVADW